MADTGAANTRKGLLVTGDLIFSTKVTGTGRALGLEIEVTPDPADAVRRVGEGGYGCVILDLSLQRLAPGEVVPALSSRDKDRPHLVAFGSHVDTARLQEARDAGCDEVMPRSQFTAELPRLLERCVR